jgi:hypothetical protein
MLKEYLNQPYPMFKDRWKLVISISMFIGSFMMIFRPFGTAFQGRYSELMLAGYGLISFVILVFDLFVVRQFFRKWFDAAAWNVRKQILWLIFIIFSIGIGNFLYSAAVFSSWTWRLFLSFQLYTLLVGIIPIVGLTLISRNHLLSRNLKQAEDFNRELKLRAGETQHHIVTLIPDNGKDRLEIAGENLLYIESIGNYIKVFHVRDKNLVVDILRCALKRAEDQVAAFPNIVRCHRAFMVNIDRVIQAKGNSLGLKLILEHAGEEIPVSRNFTKSVKSRIRRHS